MARKKTPTIEDDPQSGGSRALWKGSINFGLVSIPVRLVTAIKDRDIHFHRVTKDGGCRLRQKLVCPETGKEYDFGQTARGYEIAPQQYVLIEKEEIQSIQPQSGHGVDIIEFVDLGEIDPKYFDRPYYIIPDGKVAKPYELLRQVLATEKKVAIAKMVMHDKEYLVAIRGEPEALLIQTMHFADEVVRSPGHAAQSVPIAGPERKLASDLVRSLTKKFDPTDFHDDYRERMRELLEEKAKGKHIHTAPEPEKQPTKVVDLMERLKQSLTQNQAQSKAHRTPHKSKLKSRKRAA